MQSLCRFVEVMTFVLLTEYCDNLFVHLETQNLISLNGKLLKKYRRVPLQAWSSPEGSRKLGFPNYMTMAQDGGKVASLTHRPSLPSGNAPGTHFC